MTPGDRIIKTGYEIRSEAGVYMTALIAQESGAVMPQQDFSITEVMYRVRIQIQPYFAKAFKKRNRENTFKVAEGL